MKKTLSVLLLFSGVFLSCQQDGIWVDDAMGDRSIYLSATIENTVRSRAPYQLNSPTMDKPLWVDVWASTTPFSFPNPIPPKDGKGANGEVALHTQAKFTAWKEQLLNAAVYPKRDGTPVFFVGLHPQGWTSSDGKRASYTFTGREDVMFAPQIFGEYAENIEVATWPTFTFKHLLTWLRVEMVAENEDISKAWGKIKKLTVKSQQGVVVGLDNYATGYSVSGVSDEEAFNAAHDVTFTGEAVDMSFYKTDTDDAFEFSDEDGYTLQGPYGNDNIYDKVEEVAYVLCAPVAATATDATDNTKPTSEYVLSVTTDKRKVDIKVDLQLASGTPFEGSTMGRQFTVLLRFKLGNNVSTTAIATDWVNGGLGNGEFIEGDIQ